MYDTIIIGGGPAGSTAGIYLSRANKSSLILYKDSGALAKASKIENYYGLNEVISGEDLFEIGLNQCKNYGSELLNSQVVGIEYDGTGFKVKTPEEIYTGKTLLLATGSSKESINVTGIDAFEGKGVSYCAICDAFFYRDKVTAVVGNGEYAFHEARVLKNVSKKVYILTDGKEISFKEEDKDISIIYSKLKSLKGDTHLKEVIFEDDSSISIDGLFVAVGTAGASAIAKHIGALTDEKGYILVDQNMMTNVPGVFAAGDCIGGLHQISKASYDGMNASLAILKYIKSL